MFGVYSRCAVERCMGRARGGGRGGGTVCNRDYPQEGLGVPAMLCKAAIVALNSEWRKLYGVLGLGAAVQT